VRVALLDWLKAYGELNGFVGLASGPLEARFARLCDRIGSREVLAWTTPSLWASSGSRSVLHLQLREVGVQFDCRISDDERLIAEHVGLIDTSAPDPRALADSLGVALRPASILFAPDVGDRTDPGATAIVAVMRAAAAGWTDFVQPLADLLAAVERDEEARSASLVGAYSQAIPAGDTNALHWGLRGISSHILQALEPGEWLNLQDSRAHPLMARVLEIEDDILSVDVPSGAPPPASGELRPQIRRKILDQKRALLDELKRPAGNLPHLVQLVAAPASLPELAPIPSSSFVNAAVGRDESQSRAVSLALGAQDGQALLIVGPPGTGKSTTAAEISVQLVGRDPAVRILICSHSNHGADNLLVKVLPFLEEAASRVARVGSLDRVAAAARPFYTSVEAELRDKNLVFSTLDALALRDAAGAQLYDYVFLDEANRAGVLDSLLALARGKRLILIGDAFQLQPVLSESERGLREAASAGLTLSFFNWIQQRGLPRLATVFLDEQNRMHPAIAELVSNVFYDGRVRTGPAAPTDAITTRLIPSAVTWLDTSTLAGNVERRGVGQTSLSNEAEARVVTALVEHLDDVAPGEASVGVITAYADQRRLLRRLLGGRGVEVDTVDAFEGREKDVIILSLVRANEPGQVGFLREASRLNVAVSRARRLLVMVGDTRTLRGGVFSRLQAEVQRIGAVLPAEHFGAQRR
jgi:hypothetical protein